MHFEKKTVLTRHKVKEIKDLHKTKTHLSNEGIQEEEDVREKSIRGDTKITEAY